MPQKQSKSERALAFAREHGDAKAQLEPPEPHNDWLLDMQHEYDTEKHRIDGRNMICDVHVQYEKFAPWPECPWPNGAWRVVFTQNWDRVDLDALYDGNWGRWNTDFSVWGEFCETREQALANARAEMACTRTF